MVVADEEDLAAFVLAGQAVQEGDEDLGREAALKQRERELAAVGDRASPRVRGLFQLQFP